MVVMTFVHEHIRQVEEVTKEANASTIHHKTTHNECAVGSGSRTRRQCRKRKERPEWGSNPGLPKYGLN